MEQQQHAIVGSISPLGNGKFNVSVMNGTQANISVVATMENGEVKNMGSSTFRVKSVPKGTARFAGQIDDGSLTKGEIEAQQGLAAFYQNFDFKANCTVTSFDFSIVTNGISTEFHQEGNIFGTDLKKSIAKLRRGDKIIFSNINSIGPDKRPVKLSGLFFKVRN